MEKKGNPKKLRGRILTNDLIFLNEKKQWTYFLRDILMVFFFKADIKVLGNLLRGMRVSDEGPQEGGRAGAQADWTAWC